MNSMIKKIFLVLLAGALFDGFAIQAKLYTPNFEKSFQNQIKRHDLAVVHFNPFATDEEDEPELDDMKEGFAELSQDKRYKNADIAFIGVNLNNIPDLALDYDIEVPDWAAIEAAEDAAEANGTEPDEIDITQDQESTLMLFKEGKPFTIKGKVVKHTGFMTEEEMEDFIEAYFGDFIDSILVQKRADTQQRAQVRQARPAAQRVSTRYAVGQQPATRVYRTRVYRRPYGYYGRPYFGYWGRPWGGYRRWGYGPRFGLGFGFGRGYRRGGFGFGFGW